MATTPHGLWYPEDYNAAADVPLNMEQNTLSVEAALAAMDSKVDAATAVMTTASPIGTIVAYGGSAAPNGWHLCDGSAHGSAALQAVIGSAAAPDLRSRFIVGAGSGYAVGSQGGAASVVLGVNEMPSHNHGGITGAMTQNATHNHTEPVNSQYQGWNIAVGDFGTHGTNSSGTGYTYNANTDHQHAVSAQGGNGAHENRPPYYALTYIIRKA